DDANGEGNCSGGSSNLVSKCHALGQGKGRMQLYVAMEVPFLHCEMAIDSIHMEILVTMVIKYEEDGLELEADYRFLSQAQEVYGNNLKSRRLLYILCPLSIVSTPPKNIKDDSECIEFIKKKAVQLLKGVQYLCGDIDSLGRTSNFAHPTLRKICLAVYYCNSSKSLHQFIEFQTSVPDRALVLVSAMYVWHNDYHGNKLKRMLQEWARAGM
ncbi:hypothetical protein EDC04DRAFT_2598516, partial [Pisolithus marmoratus]